MSILLPPPGHLGHRPLPAPAITAAPTAVAAFIGWSGRGALNRAGLVQSWSDYETQYGGFAHINGGPSFLPYAVSQFFGNGGSQAYVVRLAWTDAATAAAAILGNWTIYALNPGAWGNGLAVSIVPAAAGDRFTLQVRYAAAGSAGAAPVVESFTNLTVEPADPQFVGTVVNGTSAYVTFANPANPTAALGTFSGTVTATPASAGLPLTGGADGTPLVPGDGNFETALGADGAATSAAAAGARLLDQVGAFNILCVPGETDVPTLAVLQQYCSLKRAFLIIDCPATATTAGLTSTGPTGANDTGGGLCGPYALNSAYYFPWVEAPDPLVPNQSALLPPSGFVAGLYAATDAQHGVWKAPAGTGAALTGAGSLQYALTEPENDALNNQAVNCLRQFSPYGNVVWGARTLQGNDQAPSEWRYISVRRLGLFIESSLVAGTKWAAFEPNAEPLWGQLGLQVGAFLQSLFLKGAFQGTTPQQAYYVKCDAENNPAASVAQGVVNILVGFAPLVPAEFVVIQIQQSSHAA